MSKHFILKGQTMENKIPHVIQILYPYFVTEPDPRFWPDHLKHNPIQGHALWAVYQGLRLGIQLSDACLETL